MFHAEATTLDAPTAARALEGRPGLVWLDGDGADARGRFSYLGSDPVETVVGESGTPRPWTALDAIEPRARDRGPSDAEHARLPRWIGLLAYDAALGGAGASRHVLDDGPALWFGRYDALVEVDHAGGTARLVGDDSAAVARLRERLAARPPRRPARLGTLHSEPDETHIDAVRAALDAIGRGDVYQVNLARAFEAPFDGSTLALFEAMREASPVPYGFYLRTEERAVLGRSMERFLGWERRSRRLETRPIKGTIRASGDRALEAAALRADPKEHAEHAMVVDLMRNDLGRVAEVGSVRVEAAFEVEPYARLSHLVSTIACRTRPEVGLVELLDATFPPGSVTGTPKRRAVALIDALERRPRGVYCGAVGYVSHGGDLSLAVAIRTASVADGRLRYLAGGGIVADSDPARETEETWLKTAVLRDAAQSLASTEAAGPRKSW